MKIQQHDGVVVDAAMIAAGLRRASARGRGVAGEREAPRLEVWLPSLLPLYRPPGGAPALEIRSPKGAAARGGGVLPKASGARPPPRVSYPRRRGARGAHQPTRGWFPSPLQPMGPSGMGGPTRWTPGTHPMVPIQYR